MGEQNMTDSTIGFIGLGLIGGSIARAIKRRQPQVRIMAYMRTRAKLEQAKADGIVDVILELSLIHISRRFTASASWARAALWWSATRSTAPAPF